MTSFLQLLFKAARLKVGVENGEKAARNCCRRHEDASNWLKMLSR